MEALPGYVNGLFAILLVTCFVKIVTTLSILRYGIGLKGTGFGVAILAVSIALSWMVMEPQLRDGGVLEKVVSGKYQSVEELETEFGPFLKKHSELEVTQRLNRLSSRLNKSDTKSVEDAEAEPKFGLLISSFLLSELSNAFYLGLIIIVPFVVVDLIVANVLMVLGVTQMSVGVVALPLKLLLFFVVGGWTLVAEKLVLSYT